MRKIFRSLLLVGIVLLIPIIPFALLGWWMEPAIEGSITAWTTGWQGVFLTIGLLATDIFLPVPSSVISTCAGKQLGVVTGTAQHQWFPLALVLAAALPLLVAVTRR